MYLSRRLEQGKSDYDDSDLQAVERGEIPKISILSFKGGFHGRTMATLSCSVAK